MKERKRLRVDVRWTNSEPYIWDLYHHLVTWCESYTKEHDFSEITILKNSCTYYILFYRNGDYSRSLTIFCEKYDSQEFRKLQRLIRLYFKKNKPKFEKLRDYNKELKLKRKEE